MDIDALHQEADLDKSGEGTDIIRLRIDSIFRCVYELNLLQLELRRSALCVLVRVPKQINSPARWRVIR